MADTEGKPRQLFDNTVDSFRNGACLDLRVKVAIDLLTHSPMYTAGYAAHVASGEPTTKPLATHALDVATELIALADARGLLDPLDSPEGEERLKAHVKRQVAFQLEMANEGRRAQEQSLAVGRNVAEAFKKAN